MTVITKDTINFLNDLKKNNNREWFRANKSRYDAARGEFLNLASYLLVEIQAIDPDIGPLKPGDTLFRIYRDVRFSSDKSPFKTHMGAYFVKGGKQSGNAGYYFHLEPGESFTAGGIWQPTPDILKAVRMEIYENPVEFRSIIQNKAFIDNFGEIHGEKLKTPPKGFPKDFSEIEWLKYKSFTVFRNITDKLVLSEQLIEDAVRVFQLMLPLNRFINYAIDR
jgi:uncharacterized protein (TIGR02453 family)